MMDRASKPGSIRIGERHWHLTKRGIFRLCTSCPDEFDEQADPLFVFSSYANDDADRVAFRIKSLL